jgi:hypothetical protein
LNDDDENHFVGKKTTTKEGKAADLSEKCFLLRNKYFLGSKTSSRRSYLKNLKKKK